LKHFISFFLEILQEKNTTRQLERGGEGERERGRGREREGEGEREGETENMKEQTFNICNQICYCYCQLFLGRFSDKFIIKLLNFGRNVRFQSTNEITFEVGFIS
jgi:hypothetical protein